MEYIEMQEEPLYSPLLAMRPPISQGGHPMPEMPHEEKTGDHHPQHTRENPRPTPIIRTQTRLQ